MSCACSASPKKIETQKCGCNDNSESIIKTVESCCLCPKKCQCEGGCQCASCSDNKINCVCPTAICECPGNCSCGHCKSIKCECSGDDNKTKGCSC